MKAHSPRKRFGQHFLVSPGIIEKIVAAIDPRPTDTVVEIGPGLGALTAPLLEKLDHLHVVEIDRDLIARLESRFPPERLTIHEADALQFDFGALTVHEAEAMPPLHERPAPPHLSRGEVSSARAAFAALANEGGNKGSSSGLCLTAAAAFAQHKPVAVAAITPKGERTLKIVGNLPYNISSPLLFHLARFADKVAEMHFMLQKEVVDRMVAAPGSSAYGRLSVMLQYRFQMERLFIVPPGAFDPPPKVDSAVVRMMPKKLGAGETARDEALFGRLVAAAFSQRRKMLRNTLQEFGGAALLAAQGIDPTARAETLPVIDYVRLANTLAPQ